MVTPRLQLHRFGADDPIAALPASRQREYLRGYLGDLDARAVLEETAYFDRDWLAELGAFYGESARGYPNTCRRLHFFATTVGDAELRAALGGEPRALKRLQAAYLGFCVLRPLARSPFGLTVLRWYDDDDPERPRVMSPRRYVCHLAGIELAIDGLAWQQQDTAVGTCASVALWSMLHSAAHAPDLAVPTTADITRFAHKHASLGARVFPSAGLTIFQILEAIKEAGMAPMVARGELAGGGFSRAALGGQIAAWLGSGWQLLIGGRTEGGTKHTVCVVGFRDDGMRKPPADRTEIEGELLSRVYVHDDNVGPGVRCDLIDRDAGVVISAARPPSRRKGASDPVRDYAGLVPEVVVAAVPHDVRSSLDRLRRRGLLVARAYRDALNRLRERGGRAPLGVTVAIRLLAAERYLGRELARTLAGRRDALARARLGLAAELPPLSRHVGLVRIGWGATPMLDVLLDTSEGDDGGTAFGCVCFRRESSIVVAALARGDAGETIDLGAPVLAYAGRE